MKINNINSFYNNKNNITFTQKNYNQQPTTYTNKTSKTILTTIALSAITIGGILLYKKLNTNTIKNINNFIPDEYHTTIANELNKLGINIKSEALESIVSPKQFSELINKFKPEHFRVGLQVSEKTAQNLPLEEFYKNAINGNFRISLHTHSNFSDGKATIEEFLDCASKYADKVAKLKKDDGLPPFTIALTDHDTVDGCAEAIKIIAKNPEKYKNLKFISGCEFSVQNGCFHHDITGLALNPFDKNLIKALKDLFHKRRETVQKFLDEKPLHKNKKITIENLIELEKENFEKNNKKEKKSVINGVGVVSVRDSLKYYYKLIGKPEDKNTMNYLGTKDNLPAETVINLIKNNGGYSSLTHPIKSFWRYIGDNELQKLKKLGINGIEINHQYTPSKITKLGEINNAQNADKLFEEITAKYTTFAKENNLFLSGGTDSHEKQIFSRSPKIPSEFLNDKILS